MFRSAALSASAILMALTLTVDSAKAGGREVLCGFLAGAVAGAIVGTILSNQDQRAMRDASESVYDEEVEDGYRSEFEGDGHRGYYQVVNQGYHRDYRTCRQIRTVVINRHGEPVAEFNNRSRFVCLDVGGNRWVNVDSRDYFVRVPPRPVARQPFGSVYIERRPEAPRYAPYIGRRDPGPPQVYMPSTVTRGRPAYAPPILPATPPQTYR